MDSDDTTRSAGRIRRWFGNAFALDSAESLPTPEQLKLVDRLVEEIVRREMSLPALLFLEMARPLNSLGAQTMHYFSPLVSSLFDVAGYEQFAEFLERRESIPILIRKIEEAAEAASAEQPRAGS